METMYSVEQLAQAANQWCVEHGVEPASGQAGASITERNIRYYRTLGLLDAPRTGGGQGYGEKHRLQLVGIRLLQAQGLPLSRIRELLFGRSLEELRRVEEEGLAELRRAAVPVFRPQPQERWQVTVLDAEFLLISRQGRGVPEDRRERLLKLLNSNPKRQTRRRSARKEN